MDIQTEQRNDIRIIRPIGRVDSTNAAAFEQQIMAEFESGNKKMVLDFSKLDYISSAGLRVVLIAGKKMRATPGGKLVLCALSSAIREVFQISGFLPIFTITDDLDAGVQQAA